MFILHFDHQDNRNIKMAVKRPFFLKIFQENHTMHRVAGKGCGRPQRLLERRHCGTTAKVLDRDIKGQEDCAGGFLPAVEGHRITGVQ